MDVDPGLAIVLAVAAMLVVFGLVAWRARRVARARIAALRAADSIEIEVLSPGRLTAILLATTGVVIFATPAIAIGLGEWGRAHALVIVIGVLVATTVAVLVPITLAARWTKVGRIVLDRDELRLETTTQRDAISLRDPWTMRGTLAPPGNRIEIVVALEQGATRITFRYPLLLGDPLPVPQGAISARYGTLLGLEARALHERLRSRAELHDAA